MKQRKCNLVIKAGGGLPGGLSDHRFIPGFAAGFLCFWAGAESPDSASTSQRAPGAIPWDCGQGVRGVGTLLLECLISCSLRPKPKSARPSHSPVWGKGLGKSHHGKVVPCWRGDRQHLGHGITSLGQAGWPLWVSCSWNKAGL